MKYCFFTPSYRGDLERVRMLRKSIRHFAHEKLKHYVIVPQEDFDIFRTALSDDDGVVLLKQNDYIDAMFYQGSLYRFIKSILPSSQHWRLSRYEGRPGWILQQIIKLSIPDILADEDAALVLDSDVFFIKPFSVQDLVGSAEVDRVLVRLQPTDESAMHRDYMAKAREILALPVGETNFHYMSYPFVYYKDWGRSLLAYIEQKHDVSWQRVLFNAIWFSEYCTYGIYIEEILMPDRLRIIEKPFYTGIWDRQDFDAFIEGKLNYNENTFCIVVQSNLSISPKNYSDYLERFLASSI